MSNKNDRRKTRRDPLEPVDAIPDVLASRPKKKPKRDRSWDAQRSKATYDLPPELIEEVRNISEELTAEYANAKVRVSDVARLLLEAGLEEYRKGNLDINMEPVVFKLFSD